MCELARLETNKEVYVSNDGHVAKENAYASIGYILKPVVVGVSQDVDGLFTFRRVIFS